MKLLLARIDTLDAAPHAAVQAMSSTTPSWVAPRFVVDQEGRVRH